MSLSTTLSYQTLPPTLQRPPMHDGRSDPGEMVKLLNQQRAQASATYRTVFSFTTPGDGAFHAAWQAQLDPSDTWFAIADVVATSAAGDGATWRRHTLITRAGAVVTVQSDVSVSHVTTAGVAAFAIGWIASSLYAQLALADGAGVVGSWRVALEVIRP